MLDTLFGFFARKTDLYTSPNVGQKPEDLIMQAYRKWEKVALDKHQKDKAERDEVREQLMRTEERAEIFVASRPIVRDARSCVANVKTKKTRRMPRRVSWK